MDRIPTVSSNVNSRVTILSGVAEQMKNASHTAAADIFGGSGGY